MPARRGRNRLGSSLPTAAARQTRRWMPLPGPRSQRPPYSDSPKSLSNGSISAPLMKSEEKEALVTRSSLPNLPTHILEEIISLVPLADYRALSLVSKEWRSLTPPVYPADICPLLVHSPISRCSRQLHFYSPAINKDFVVDNSPLVDDLIKGARIHTAAYGMLLLQKGQDLILANPFTGSQHKLPELDDFFWPLFALAGRALPNFFLFAVNCLNGSTTSIAVCRGGQEWTYYEFENESSFHLSPASSTAIHKGHLYCLGNKGNLGVFDPQQETWTIRESPRKFYCCFDHSYLVESEGELLAVLTAKKQGTPIRVLRLDEVRLTWTMIHDLKGRALFLGLLPTSKSMITPSAELMNKVYLDRVGGEPEEIHAKLEFSGGRVFFKDKARTSFLETDEGRTSKSRGALYCYSFKDGENFKISECGQYITSVWLNPTLAS